MSDTFHTEEGKTLLSSLAVACLKGEETSNYDARSKVLELAVPVQSPDVQQLQGVMLVSVSAVDIAETLAEMEQRGVMLIGSIVVLSVFLAWLLSTILVKPLARVTKAIEDLTDGMLDEEISVPDYTETELITDAFNKMVNRMKILDESRQEFVSNVSHELKTPIALIQGYAEGLKDNVIEDDESKEFYCDVILDEAGKMNKLVRQLLDLNELEFGVDRVHPVVFDIDALIKNVVDSSSILVEQNHAEVELADELNDVCNVYADEFMIEQVFTNYFTNALHYCNDGGKVRVWTANKDYDQPRRTEDGLVTGNLRVFVYDEGPNIPDDELDKVFIKFYKVDKARTREYGGSGIGLSIVAASMAAHNKNYGVYNVENGVVFYFDLDIIQQDDGEPEMIPENNADNTSEQ